MKKIICIILITVTSILSGCNSTSDEEIISSQDFNSKKAWPRRQSTSKDRIASAYRQRHSAP